MAYSVIILSSRALASFVSLTNLIAFLCAAGAVLVLIGWRVTGYSALAVGFALLLLFGLGPMSTLIFQPLAARFPDWQNHGGEPTGVIVLGGATDPSSEGADPWEHSSEAGRITAAARLAQQFPSARIVFSGGESFAAAGWLQGLGVSRDRIELEPQSRNTAENAAYTFALLQPKSGERWVLVTSDYHIPRAVGCFRAVGFHVEPYPVHGARRGERSFWAALRARFDRTDHAIHE